jgi:hypothetical protein
MSFENRRKIDYYQTTKFRLYCTKTRDYCSFINKSATKNSCHFINYEQIELLSVLKLYYIIIKKKKMLAVRRFTAVPRVISRNFVSKSRSSNGGAGHDDHAHHDHPVN